MTRHCGEFCNPWPLDIYAAVCGVWCGVCVCACVCVCVCVVCVCVCVCVCVWCVCVRVCVLLGEGGSIDQLNFFKFSKGFIHFFPITFISLLTEIFLQ